MKTTAASLPGQSTVEKGTSPPTEWAWRGKGCSTGCGKAA